MVQIFVSNNVNELQIAVNEFLMARVGRKALHTSIAVTIYGDGISEYVLSLTYAQ